MSLRKQIVELNVQIDPAWRASDRLQAFTDFGGGTIDTSKPLLTTPVPIFPDDIRDTVAHGGYGDDPYGNKAYGGERATTRREHGYGFDAYGQVDYGDTFRHVLVTAMVDQAYGTWKFAAQAIDGAGNQQGALQEFTRFISGEEPPPLSSFAYDSYAAGTDKVTFTFAP